MYVSCECCVLSGGGLCDALITRPEKSERDVSECNSEGSTTRAVEPWKEKKNNFFDVTPVRNSRVNNSIAIKMLHVSERTLINFYLCTNMDAQFEKRDYLNTLISNAFNT